MQKLLLFTSCLFLLSTVSFAQEDTELDEYEKNYQKRIKKERLFGVYVPKDLTETFIELNRKIDLKSRAKFKNASEEEAARKLHFSLGRWMMHNWGFYEGSRLSHYLKAELGVSYPDDMARFIIIAYHRNLNKKELKIKELSEHFQQLVEEREKERKMRGKVIHEEKRKRQN